MTMTLLAFDELPNGAQIGLQTSDRGMLSGIAVDPSTAVVTPAAVGAVLAASEAQVRYYDKAGSAGGTGSRAQPFATAQQALTSITDAGPTKPYVVAGGVGTFLEPYLLKPWTFLVGKNRLATVMAPPAGNVLDPSFGVAGAQETGIAQCTLAGSNVTVDFAAVGSLGAGRFRLADCYLDGVGMAVTGFNNTNIFVAQNIEQIATTVAAHTFVNINSNVDGLNLRTNNILWSTTGAYGVTHVLGMVRTQGTVTSSAAVSAAFSNVVASGLVGPAANGIFITGDGALFAAPLLTMLVGMPDADTTFAWSNQVGATKLLSGGGSTVIGINTTAERTATFLGAPPNNSRLTLRNSGQFATPLTLTGLGFPSYVRRHSSMELLIFSTGWLPLDYPNVQFDAVTLVNGLSPLILCDMTIATAPGGTNTSITATLVQTNGGASVPGVPSMPAAMRVGNTRALGGGFQIESLIPGTNTRQVADQGTYNWTVFAGV